MGLGLGRHAYQNTCLPVGYHGSAAPAPGADPEAAANQKKARATLDAMVTALGGQRWLALTQRHAAGPDIGLLSRQAHRYDL